MCGLDTDSVRAGQLNNGQAPFHEPGLPEMLKATLSTGRLRFTDRPAEALTDADFVFLCVGTPPGRDGSPDLTQLESAIQSLAPYLRADAVIVNKSTVPVGSGNWTRTILEDALEGNRELSFHVVSNPEFLREGSAIDDFLYPDRIVLGGAASDVSRVAELYQPVLDQSFDGGRRGLRPSLITTELASAEMIKYAANAFLATKISFANEMAQMCELFGADVRQVLPAIGADHRVGTAFLNRRCRLGWFVLRQGCCGADLDGPGVRLHALDAAGDGRDQQGAAGERGAQASAGAPHAEGPPDRAARADFQARDRRPARRPGPGHRSATAGRRRRGLGLRSGRQGAARGIRGDTADHAMSTTRPTGRTRLS